MKKILFLCIVALNSTIGGMQTGFEKAYWSLSVNTKPTRPDEHIYRIIAHLFKNDLLLCVAHGNDKLEVCLNERLSENEIKERLKSKKWFHPERLGKEQEWLLNARSESMGPIPFIIQANQAVRYIKEHQESCRKSQSLIVRR